MTAVLTIFSCDLVKQAGSTSHTAVVKRADHLSELSLAALPQVLGGSVVQNLKHPKIIFLF